MSELPVPFKGNQLPDRISSNDIELSTSLEIARQRPPLGLMGDVQVSRYGAIGLTFLDSAPENRIHNWNSGSDYYGYESEDEPEEYMHLSFQEASRNYGTRKGFKVIRYSILPQKLVDVLSTNQWVGPAVIQQALEDGVAPSEYQEENVGIANSFYTHMPTWDRQEQQKGQELFNAKIAYLEHVLRSLDGSIPEGAFKFDKEYVAGGVGSWLVLPKSHAAYISFHPWAYFGRVSEEYPKIIQRMLSNVDSLMSSVVDRDGTIESSLRDELAQDSSYLPIARLAIESSKNQ